MSPTALHALREQRLTICERWTALLRVEPVNSPLALPDALVHLIPDSVEEVLRELERPGDGRLTLGAAHKVPVPVCGCNRNPYLAYFKAGEQALLETLVLEQAKMDPSQRRESDLAQLIRATRSLAAAEIDTFCGVCTHHAEGENCRFQESVN